MSVDPAAIRALALHAALTTGPERYALQRAARFERVLTEYVQTGDVAELHPPGDEPPRPGPLEAIKRAMEAREAAPDLLSADERVRGRGRP